MVPSYQPETAYAIFSRALFNRDVATGSIAVEDGYATKGPDSTWHILNDVLAGLEPECYILSPPSCEKEDWAALRNGTAVVKDWIVVGRVKETKSEGESKSGSKTKSNADGAPPPLDFPASGAGQQVLRERELHAQVQE